MKVKCHRILIVTDPVTFKLSKQMGMLLSGSHYFWVVAIFEWLKMFVQCGNSVFF